MKRRTKNLKNLSSGIIDYRQAKENLKINYPNYSATTQVNWNVSKQEYEIECGSEFAKKILHRKQVRLIEFEDKAYLKLKDKLSKWEKNITHYITTSPIQPNWNNEIKKPLSITQLRHQARCLFDYFVSHNQGTNVIMCVRLEANPNKAQTVKGWHLHALTICTDMDNDFRTQKEELKELTQMNLGEYSGPYTTYVVPFDYSYRQTKGWTALDYIHKEDKDVLASSINYFLIK